MPDNEYSCSLGIKTVVDTFYEFARTQSALCCDTVLVNLATIVRSNTSLSTDVSVIADKTRIDLQRLTEAIVAYFDAKRTTLDKPYIVVYVPVYQALPNLLRRDLSPVNTQIERVLTEIKFKYFEKKRTTCSDIREIPCYVTLAGTPKQYPHSDLTMLLIKHNNGPIGIKRVDTRRYLLISHNPIDFHLFSQLKNMWLMESYTGAIKRVSDLGKKVFKSDDVPFNAYTHAMLGDSAYVKGLVVRKEKTQLLKLAASKVWMTKLPISILKDTLDAHIVDKTKLELAKF